MSDMNTRTISIEDPVYPFPGCTAHDHVCLLPPDKNTTPRVKDLFLVSCRCFAAINSAGWTG